LNGVQSFNGQHPLTVAWATSNYGCCCNQAGRRTCFRVQL